MSFLVTHTCNECQKLHGFAVSGFKWNIKLYLSVDVNKHLLGQFQQLLDKSVARQNVGHKWRSATKQT